jgi:hypothetical protein
MVKIHRFFEENNSKSGMLLQIHDEILFEISLLDLDMIEHIKEIMVESWPAKFHKMDCSIEYSEKSWADMEEYGSEARDRLSEKSEGETKGNKEFSRVLYRSGSFAGAS